MEFRKATIEDYASLHRIRMAVRENVLSDPSRVTRADYEEMIAGRGEGWVCLIDNEIRGFSFADFKENNIWALFVEPGFEKQGIGRRLHDLAVQSLFDAGAKTAWLTTGPATRAFKFYTQAGWKVVGEDKDDVQMELAALDWKKSAKPGPVP